MLKALVLPRDVHAPALARREVGALGLDSRLHADASLLVSELVTNSVLHGAGEAVRVRLETDDLGGLRCEVLDDGAGFLPTPPAVRRDAGGWGLQLVDRLADRWGVADGSTHVWFELAGGVRPTSTASSLAVRVG